VCAKILNVSILTGAVYERSGYMSSPQRRFSRIFAVIDPTRFVQTAYLRAEAIARSNGAKLIAYCCISEGNGESPGEKMEDRVRVVRESIERMASLPDDQLDIEVEFGGDWRRKLVDAAVASDTDLVVKAASRHSLVGRVFSATADWMLLREAKQPILLVADRHTIRTPRRLLAAIKLKPEDAAHESLNEEIVELSHYLGEVVGFEVHATTAFKGDDVYFDRQRFADFCRVPRNRVHAVQGAAYVAIARAASEVEADTIIIGNPDTSETAQRLIDHADADMIVLPH
jgi:nucleotide-binding universal stress UspA family protein